ncbi:hypothetical protein SIN8267_03445 [Sinobacterium norvegicum]|uniref:Transcriptional regulator SutA RNAP-binding domain-containing protein n=1 Tax=Sinobacterium norvegicum TaxID=1641715 RepID=A0ABN8EPT5_9GAMM|nr:hypothetical protein [Sinobacterium norvegicum]CAH0993297.1 hypothetical protein SIN8267_03445 [Sinobacterium norvegicum]
MTSVPRCNSLPSREAIRNQIANEVAEFLSKGGTIDKIQRPNDPAQPVTRSRPWMGDIL